MTDIKLTEEEFNEITSLLTRIEEIKTAHNIENVTATIGSNGWDLSIKNNAGLRVSAYCTKNYHNSYKEFYKI